MRGKQWRNGKSFSESTASSLMNSYLASLLPLSFLLSARNVICPTPCTAILFVVPITLCVMVWKTPIDLSEVPNTSPLNNLKALNFLSTIEWAVVSTLTTDLKKEFSVVASAKVVGRVMLCSLPCYFSIWILRVNALVKLPLPLACCKARPAGDSP